VKKPRSTIDRTSDKTIDKDLPPIEDAKETPEKRQRNQLRVSAREGSEQCEGIGKTPAKALGKTPGIAPGITPGKCRGWCRCKMAMGL
jgi:hypothetical protein